MTSIPNPLPAQGQSTQSPANGSISGKTSPDASARSYANATSSAGTQHGKSGSTTIVNGTHSMQQPPVPGAGGLTIVNGNTAPTTQTSNPASSLHSGDHSRKPSVTISAAGASGFIPNGGGPGAGPSGRTAGLKFGSLDSQGPSMTNPSGVPGQSQQLNVAQPPNPRVPSPQSSPSPIPQPLASGGRPPSTLSNSNINFGNFSGEQGDANRSMRSGPQPPLGPGPQSTHLRRESSQSAHGDMGFVPGGHGRGSFGGQGRNRPFGQQQMPYSPNQSYRSTSNSRGGPNMQHQFHGHGPGRSLSAFPGSPHQAARSPALANAHPATPPMPHVPMANPQMQAQHYGGYPQHMGPQQGYVPQGYDPGFYYQGQPYPMHQMPYNMGPPAHGMPANTQPPYMPGQYSNQGHAPPQATPLSRNPSQVSAADRPGSSASQAQASPAPASQGHGHSASRSTSSPVPTSNFVIPPKKSAITIRNPESGNVMTFDKQASPARATPSPVKQGTTPTSTPPPPRTASRAETEQPAESKTEPKSQTEEERKQAFHDKIMQKARLEAEAEEVRKKTEALKISEEEQSKQKEAEDAKARADEEAKKEAEKASQEKEKAAAAADTEKKEEPSKPVAPAAPEEDEIDYDAIEREMAELAEKEAAAEAAYQEKKKREREEKERKEKEEAEAFEANMKNAEREAEAAEEERERKRAAGGDEEATKKELFASLKGKTAQTPTSTESPAVRTPADSGAATPVSDISMGPPMKPAAGGKREKPAALKLETNKTVEPPQPSAAMKSLQTARFLEDPSKVTYPPSVVSPNPALNANAPVDRKFKYNKEFLLQFQAVFKEKPSLDWDSKVRETVGDSGADSSRPGSARTPMGARTTSRQGIPSGFTNNMGNFGKAAPGRAQTMPIGGQEAFSMGGRPPMGANPFGPFARGPGGMAMGGSIMSRNNSSSTMHQMPSSPRVGSSHRGSTRSGSKRDKPNKKEEESNKSMPLTAGLDIKPLAPSSTGWKPRSVGNTSLAGPAPGGEGHLPPDVVQRKVKSNLNKMTPEKFDRIADQILAIVSQSKDESDGRTLRQVIQLTFEKATDEAHWAPMYAKFAKKMLDSMSPEIKDENIRDRQGNVVTGGSLFRKYLLNRCQEEFERGWKVNLPEKPEGSTEEAAMMSDEYYAAAAAKRRGLGLVKFIGELYKLGMLTERIMHECVKKLVDFEGTPEEAEVESLTSLLRTIGHPLDNSDKGRSMMDAYFQRIHKMIEMPTLNSRLKFMLMDIVDLRKAGWLSKDADKGPKTMAEIREAAIRAQQEQEMERMRQQANRGGGRMPLGRGDVRNMSGGYGHQPPPDFASSKVGTDDLRRLKTTRNTNQPMSFGPSSMFGSRSNSGRRNLGPGGNLVRGGEDSGASSRTGTPPGGKDKKDDKESASSMNAFSALAALDGENHDNSPPSNPNSPQMTKSRPAVEQPKASGQEE